MCARHLGNKDERAFALRELTGKCEEVEENKYCPV